MSSMFVSLLLKGIMKTQKDVVGKWDRHSQLVYFGQTFWGEYGE